MLRVILQVNGTTANMFSILAPLNLSGWAPWNSPMYLLTLAVERHRGRCDFLHQLDTSEPKRLDGLTDNRSLQNPLTLLVC